MKFFTSVFITALVSVALSQDVTVLAGTKPAGDICTAPMECLEPLYCLKKNDKEHACGKKPCKGQGECRIGQFCDKEGFCAAPTCTKDDECSGSTVCQTAGNCGSKSSGGQACTRGTQCWSGKCADGKCTGSDGSVSDSDPPATNEETAEETAEGEDDQGIVGDTVDAVGDVAGGAADVVDGTVKKAFSIGGGGIAGIIIGCLILLGICCGILFCCRKVRNRGDN